MYRILITTTFQKLIKRTIFADHLALLIERQDVLLAQLTQIANEGFSKAKEEWEKNLLLWGTDLTRSPSPFSISLCFYHHFLLRLTQKYVPYPDKRQEKLRTEVAEASTGTGSAGPTRHPTEEMDVDSNSNQPSGVGGTGGDAEGGKEGKEGNDHGQHPPAKRYRLTDTMKSMVWELVLISNECCRLENEKKSVFS